MNKKAAGTDDYVIKEPKEPYYQPNYYAITVNPSDDYQKIFTGVSKKMLGIRIPTTLARYKEITEWLTPILQGYRYTLYWDISCPTDMNYKKFPRLHLHGIIDLRDQMQLEKFLLITSQRLAFGSSVKMVKLKDEEQMENWKKYCKKYTNVVIRDPLTNQDRSR